MKYWESDLYPGVSMGCYLDPTYHPGCLGCADREDCYGWAKYPKFRAKALAISRFLGDGDDIPAESAPFLAWVMKARNREEDIWRILATEMCVDRKLTAVVKVSLGIDVSTGENNPRARRFA